MTVPGPDDWPIELKGGPADGKKVAVPYGAVRVEVPFLSVEKDCYRAVYTLESDDFGVVAAHYQGDIS